jgi:hypothetical protein
MPSTDQASADRVSTGKLSSASAVPTRWAGRPR